MQEHLFAKEKEGKISIIWNHQVDEVLGDAQSGVTSVRIKSTLDGSTQNVNVTGMFVAIGHKPNSSMFEGQLELRDGYIQCKAVQQAMQHKLLYQVYLQLVTLLTVFTVRPLLLQVQAVWLRWTQINILMRWANWTKQQL